MDSAPAGTVTSQRRRHTGARHERRLAEGSICCCAFRPTVLSMAVVLETVTASGLQE